MAENIGVSPLDPNTPTGKVRLTIGDVTATNVADGLGEYSYFSDDEIAQFLVAGGDSPTRAVGYGYLAWAGQAAAEALAIKDFDLSVDYSKRAEALRKTAEMYFGLADGEDVATGGAEEFLIVDTGTNRSSNRAEGVTYSLWDL